LTAERRVLYASARKVMFSALCYSTVTSRPHPMWQLVNFGLFLFHKTLQCFSVHVRLYGRILVHVQWTGSVAPVGRVMCENIWPSRDWIVSWSAVTAWWSERLLNVKESASYYHSSLLEYRFTVWSIKPVTNTSLHDLNVEIGTTTESRVYRTLSWCRVELAGDARDPTGDDTWSSTGDTWRPRPRPSPSFYPVNLGRQSLRSGLLLVYRVACCRDGRPTSLKDTLLRRICFYYSFSFVISLVILISNVSSSNFRCLFSLNLSNSISSSCK